MQTLLLVGAFAALCLWLSLAALAVLGVRRGGGLSGRGGTPARPGRAWHAGPTGCQLRRYRGRRLGLRGSVAAGLEQREQLALPALVALLVLLAAAARAR